MGNGWVVAGAAYTDDVLVKNGAGLLVDPDAGTLTLAIKNPAGATILTVPQASMTRLGIGHFQYTWQTATSTTTGLWSWEWDGTVEGANYPNQPIPLIVLPVGSIVPDELTVAELRSFVKTPVPDADLQTLINAAYTDILTRYGPVGPVTLTVRSRYQQRIYLDRPAAAVVSATEFYADPIGTGGVALNSTDWRLSPDGTVLERWPFGSNPGDYWSERVELVLTPADDTAARKRIALLLVKLDLNASPGLVALSAGGEYSETHDPNYVTNREAILASLNASGALFA